MIRILLVGLSLTIALCGNEEVSFSLLNDSRDNSSEYTEIKKSKKLALLFPQIKDSLGENLKPGLIELSYEEKIFSKWFTLMHDIAIEQNGTLSLPESYPQSLVKKIYNRLEDLNFVDYQKFINLGDFLQVPDALMQYVCNSFSKKFLSNENLSLPLEFLIKNTVMQNNFDYQLGCIRDMFMLSKNLLQLSSEADSQIQIGQIDYPYVFSRKNSFIAYFAKGDRAYIVYFADFSTKINKSTVQQHLLTRDYRARNRKKIIKCAAQEACFLTIHPYDDHIIIHHVRDRNKNRVFKLDLVEGQKIACCDISADGAYVIVGYTFQYAQDDNKFVVYDQNGKAINTIPAKGETPKDCICNPNDSTTAVLITNLANRQYTATLENNMTKMPFGNYTDFLISNNNLSNVKYSATGKYIFVLSFINGKAKLYRLDAMLLENMNEYDLPVADAVSVPDDVWINDAGDIAVIKFHNTQHKHTLILVDYVHGTVDLIRSDNPTSCSINGYLLVYTEKIQEKENIVFFDALYKRELLRVTSSSRDSASSILATNIIGFSKDNELIMEKKLLQRDNMGGPFLGYAIVLASIMNKECWENISESLRTYYFLPQEDNWLNQLYILLNTLKDPLVRSSEDWISKAALIFSEDFRKTLEECIDFKKNESQIAASAIIEQLRSKSKRSNIQQSLQKIQAHRQIIPSISENSLPSLTAPLLPKLKPAVSRINPALQPQSNQSPPPSVVSRMWSAVTIRVNALFTTAWNTIMGWFGRTS